jgi:hypothetical protein
MEIKDYLKTLGRRIWIPLIVPVLAGGVAFSIASGAPESYAAKATVTLGGLQSGPVAAKQLVDDFSAAVRSEKVQDEAAAETGVPRSAIKGHVTVSQVTNGTIMTASFKTSATYRDRAPEVIKAVAQGAVSLTLRSPVGVGEESVKTARESYDTAQGALAEFSQKSGVPPEDLYQGVQTELLQLRIRYEEAAADNNTGQVEYYRKAIKAREDRLNQLGPDVERYRSLKAARDKALAKLSTAEDTLDQASGRLAAARSDSIVSVSDKANEVPKASSVMRATVAAVGGGIVIALALLVALEMLGIGGQRRKPAPPAGPSTNGSGPVKPEMMHPVDA